MDCILVLNNSLPGYIFFLIIFPLDFSGAGFGPGIPGLQLGFGLGVGCGVGVGFGYGTGRGVAYDEERKYSNVGRLFHRPGNLPTQ